MLTYKDLTPTQFVKVIKALYHGNRNEKSLIESMITATIYLSGEQKYLALEYGGVDNWHGYDYAKRQANKDGEDWSELREETKLSYLENEGVDNWGCYSEAIKDYKLNYYDEYLSNDTDLIEDLKEDLKDYLSYYNDKAEIFNQKANELFRDE